MPIEYYFIELRPFVIVAAVIVNKLVIVVVKIVAQVTVNSIQSIELVIIALIGSLVTEQDYLSLYNPSNVTILILYQNLLLINLKIFIFLEAPLNSS